MRPASWAERCAFSAWTTAPRVQVRTGQRSADTCEASAPAAEMKLAPEWQELVANEPGYLALAVVSAVIRYGKSKG